MLEAKQIGLIENAIQEAIEIAKNAPEEYRQSVFQVMFELLLRNGVVHERKTDKTARHESKKDEENAENRDILGARYEWSSTKISKLDGVAQYLAVIEIALNEFKIDGLTPKEIHDVLFEKFRIAKTTNTISMALMKAVGNYVDRIKIENGYKYRITREGIEFLRQEEAKVQ
jgi:hypothetical protein